MDSFTQLALGAAIGQAVAGRRIGRSAAVLGAFCGTLPDLDVLIRYADPVAQMTYHRGFSHSLFWLTLAAPVITWLATRFAPWRGGGRRLLLAVWLALITHPVLDAFTVYGTQLALPFSDYPVSIGSIFIIDPIVTALLLVGVYSACFGTRTHERLHTCLATVAGYLVVSVVAQWQLEWRSGDALPLREAAATEVKALPTAFNTLRWRLLARDAEGYCDQFVWAWEQPVPTNWRCRNDDPALAARLAGHWPVARLMAFTHGWFALQQRGDDIVISDLRMGVRDYYIFRFVVAEQRDDGVVPVAARQLPPRRPTLDAWRRAYAHPQ